VRKSNKDYATEAPLKDPDVRIAGTARSIAFVDCALVSKSEKKGSIERWEEGDGHGGGEKGLLETAPS